MEKTLTLGSLFDAIGGFPYGASFYGIRPLWASEIMPECISVTRRHFFGYGPCGGYHPASRRKAAARRHYHIWLTLPGLSVSGLRRGLADERSGLFSEAVRIIYEMRETTHGEYPKFALWENVPYVLQRIRHVPGFLDGVRTGREIHQRFKTLFHAGQQHRRALRRLHHAGHPANFIKEGFDPWPMCQSRRT